MKYLYNRPTPNAQRPTPNAQRPTPNAQRPSYAQNQNDTIHVVLCVYDPSGTYSQHAGVVMTSIFENTTSKVTIHLLHDDTLTEDNRAKFIRTAEKYSQGLELHDVTKYKNVMNDEIKAALRHLTIGALYRLCLPEVLFLHKVIYLDCDIVVNLDIKELWSIDVENYPLAGVHKKGFETPLEALRDWLNGNSCKTHINTGILIMNLDVLREKCDLFNDSIRWLLRRKHLVLTGDQDILNTLFYRQIKLIDNKYNNSRVKDEHETHNSILHTPGFDKTWDLSGIPPQRLYWHHYLRSAWGDNKSMDELVDVMFEASRSTQPVRSVLRRTLSSVRIALSFFKTAATYIIKDAYYRLKYKLSGS